MAAEEAVGALLRLTTKSMGIPCFFLLILALFEKNVVFRLG
ncbi:hypothetical protein SAMD00020551_1848 [Mesobacillus selenatarsenatis SF-1]|uniref:Uncharacterized protein n=1 Tax=Mesobacillus selenatarsenatis (strain DSM 18680 / JCM 14380 / FERM P-15431 / SF-1) TaxID=1321606 RepID=A0A0A8X3U0_MESS1|nr:hypothetical protein SAMD00020551_1848 [Mesobacillus selenatarsenatis SF-1]